MEEHEKLRAEIDPLNVDVEANDRSHSIPRFGRRGAARAMRAERGSSGDKQPSRSMEVRLKAKSISLPYSSINTFPDASAFAGDFEWSCKP